MKLLFVTWDGPATNYHEALFIPLLAKARKPGDEIALLQYTWGDEPRTIRIAQVATRHQMTYQARRVWWAGRGILVPVQVVGELIRLFRRFRQGNFDLLMARSIIPGGLGISLRLICGKNLRFIYDADGLSADERVEFGGWSDRRAPYRILRFIEKLAVRRADVVLVRTPEAASILAARARVSVHKFEVVVNGKDELSYCSYDEMGRQATRSALGIPLDAPLIVFVGSLGPQYLPELMFSFAQLAISADPRCHLLVLTSITNHAKVADLARKAGVENVTVLEVSAAKVPQLLAACDLGLALRLPTLSQKAVAPIKVAEYTLCGVPVVYTCGVGALDSQLVPTMSYGLRIDDQMDGAVKWFLEEVMPQRNPYRMRARQCGIDYFSLTRGGDSYRNAIRRTYLSVDPKSVSKEKDEIY